MHLVLDADALIKLNFGAVLDRVVATFPCVVPQAVYAEVVIEGMARDYPDAKAIGDVLASGAGIAPDVRERRYDPTLGAGELAILNPLPTMEDATVVSDDRQFCGHLTRERIPFLSPVNLVVVLAKEGVLTGEEANQALDRLRPATRDSAYWQARNDIDSQ